MNDRERKRRPSEVRRERRGLDVGGAVVGLPTWATVASSLKVAGATPKRGEGSPTIGAGRSGIR